MTMMTMMMALDHQGEPLLYRHSSLHQAQVNNTWNTQKQCSLLFEIIHLFKIRDKDYKCSQIFIPKWYFHEFVIKMYVRYWQYAKIFQNDRCEDFCPYTCTKDQQKVKLDSSCFWNAHLNPLSTFEHQTKTLENNHRNHLEYFPNLVLPWFRPLKGFEECSLFSKFLVYRGNFWNQRLIPLPIAKGILGMSQKIFSKDMNFVDICTCSIFALSDPPLGKKL